MRRRERRRERAARSKRARPAAGYKIAGVAAGAISGLPVRVLDQRGPRICALYDNARRLCRDAAARPKAPPDAVVERDEASRRPAVRALDEPRSPEPLLFPPPPPRRLASPLLPEAGRVSRKAGVRLPLLFFRFFFSRTRFCVSSMRLKMPRFPCQCPNGGAHSVGALFDAPAALLDAPAHVLSASLNAARVFLPSSRTAALRLCPMSIVVRDAMKPMPATIVKTAATLARAGSPSTLRTPKCTPTPIRTA